MAFLDETSRRGLRREMSKLAAELTAEGCMRLRLPGKTRDALQKLPDTVAAFAGRGEMDMLTHLEGSVRLMQACAQRTALEGGARLPACGEKTRIERVAGALMELGAGDLSDLQLGLMAFDQVQGLTMAEYWAFPEAMRVHLCRAYQKAAEGILRAARDWCAAEDWIYTGGGEEISGKRPAFYERALQLALEMEKPEMRQKIENTLRRADTAPDACVRLAQERRGLALMRIDGIAAMVRVLEAADWQKAFEAVSATEAELREDPAGTYPAMTADSRSALRGQVTCLARRLGVGETTVARYAVSAARENRQDPIRGGICWWIYEDEGRRALARRMGVKKPLPRMIPDPRGAGYRALFLGAFALLTLCLSALAGSLWWAFALAAPVWRLTGAWMAQAGTRLRRPRPVLQMEYETLPEDRRTLVTLPVLISSARSGRKLCENLETLGCLEQDENLDYLLLGDFPDAAQQDMPCDGEILAAVGECMEEMNRRAGREKYFYLHRGRTEAAADAIFRGRARKPGALMALGRLICGEAGEFTAEGEACGRIAGRYRYVITLDADTRMLPGTAHRMVGAIAHPLNARREWEGGFRGFSLMEPMVELDAEACKNDFVGLFAGYGGVSAYAGVNSDLFHDYTGFGTYCGKAVIDMPEFVREMEGKLAEERILSHDFIEGAIAGAGHLNDVSVYDGFPADMRRFLARLHRWTRGDWQLLPELGRRDIPGLDRFRMFSHLADSLAEAGLMATLIFSLWLGKGEAFCAGLILHFLAAAPAGILGDRTALRRAGAELTVLPAVAWTRLDAAARALYRMFISKKKLLDWVVSADASGSGLSLKVPCRTAAILLIPGLFSGLWILPALGLGLLFLCGPGYLAELSESPEKQELSEAQADFLRDLARDTWEFFERYVTEESHFLPPDNVQLDPDAGAARRTSPTNIAMYLISCVAAREMGFLGEGEMRGRMEQTMDTLEKMEKWHGHIYNWYATDSLMPLKPRYVSAVDSGNLAAGLLACAGAVEGPLAGRMEKMARTMDFTRLYDARRKLFHIGEDVEKGRLSASYYDLLASESRILVFTAMRMGQIPPESWRKMGRPTSGGALLSWSGTMFEYLMPDLFMRSMPHTLLGETHRKVVRAQMQYGAARKRPWGVSESGYCAFDMHLNYQYRAFGMRELSMGGVVSREVVAPYAGCLALQVFPRQAAENLEEMAEMGWKGECGLYEAVDYTRIQPRIVKSWMSHHQGMSLCAICNALKNDALVQYYMNAPEARALSPLLNEKSAPRLRLRRVEQRPETLPPAERSPGRRRGRPESRAADLCLLGGGQAFAPVFARGQLAYRREELWACRFGGDLLRRRDGMQTWVRGEAGDWLLLNSEDSASSFGPGEASFENRTGVLRWEMKLCVSPEDGALVKRVTVTNRGTSPAKGYVLDAFEAAMMTQGELQAHPAFFRLFLEAKFEKDGILFIRRAREREKEFPALAHLSSLPCQKQADWRKLMSREGVPLPWQKGFPGPQTDPGSGLWVPMEIAPGETKEVDFSVGLYARDELEKALEKRRQPGGAARAAHLAGTHVHSLMSFCGLDGEKRMAAERAGALLLDPRLAARTGAGVCPPLPGLPGETPLVLLTLPGREALGLLHEAVRMHEYLRAMGLTYHLALINDQGTDYQQPLRDGMEEILSAGYLRDLRGAPGGFSVFEGERLSPQHREALHRCAALIFEGETGYWLRLRQQLLQLELGENQPCAPMRPEHVSHPEEHFGRWVPEGYEIFTGPGQAAPAPWSNLICTESGVGGLFTERGGGFFWQENSRLRRITNFDNDPVCEGWGTMIYLVDVGRREYLRALPGWRPWADYRVRHTPWESAYSVGAGGLRVETAVYAMEDIMRFRVEICNLTQTRREISTIQFMDWLMGADASDAAKTRAWHRDGALFAAGAFGVAYLAAAGGKVETCPGRTAFLGRGGVLCPDGLTAQGDGGCALRVRTEIPGGESVRVEFALGWADSMQKACAEARKWAQPGAPGERQTVRKAWEDFAGRMVLTTGDTALDQFAGGFLLKQILDGRIRARAGFYQAGGAYGFRDQLQDMLALLPRDPERVRAHLLLCAERQFQAGDGMHWWHPPMTGVRTHISDDILFLPLVTAAYVRHTGDTEILETRVNYLEDVEIPENAKDIYGPMRLSGESGTLHDHCMRAFRRAWRKGRHDLLLMGGGDWNDGMDRVGCRGRGESVWLTMFYGVCAGYYAGILPRGEDRGKLEDQAGEARSAVERAGWDGTWYLRAYDDEGRTMGSAESAECRIDLISQAWSVLGGLKGADSAMDAAWKQLFLPEAKLMRLLTPPFTGKTDPGYIAAYPPGVRENGGQYTHAACWYLLALALQGDTVRAKTLLEALLPMNHALTWEDAKKYRVEPYVLAADVYGEEPFLGRGGWTWYTGAAGWLLCALTALAGFEQKGDRVRMNALAGLWERPRIRLQYKTSVYEMESIPEARNVTCDGEEVEGPYVTMVDDGKIHRCVFPQRRGRK